MANQLLDGLIKTLNKGADIMTHEEYLKGIEEMLEYRINTAESLIIGSFFKNPELYSDYKIKEELLGKDGFFYYKIGEKMYIDGNNVFNDTSVCLLLDKSPTLKEGWDKRGGWSTIREIMSKSEPKNIESYIDDFNKYQYVKFLHNKGFSIDFDKIDKMSAKQAVSWYEYMIANDDIQIDNDVEFEPLYMTKNEIEDLKNGALQGIQYGAWDYSPDENEKHIYAKPHRKPNKDGSNKIYTYHGGCLPLLNNITLGLERANLTMIGSYINKGKSSLMFGNFVIAVVEHGYKTLYISNEQDALNFKILLTVYVATKYYNYYGLTRRKIKAGTFSDEDEKYMYLVQDFIKKFYYDTGLLQFCKIYDYNMDKVCRATKRFAKRGGNILFYDVLKAEDNEKATSELISNSKVLFQLVSKLNLAGVVTMQLQMGLENKQRFLDMGCLSFSKHVLEVFSAAIFFRDLWEDEIDTESKFYCKPYKWIKDENTGKYDGKKELELNSDKKYSVAFVVKSRADEVGQTILLEKNLSYNQWDEFGYCKISTQNKN